MEPTEAGAPQRVLLSARSDYREGFARLLELMQRELRIFDPDLSELEMNSPARVAALDRFLRASRTRRIFVALHDIGHVTRHCPRLLRLLSSHSGHLLIYRTQGDAAKVQDCFVLADAEHLIRRPVTAQPRGVMILNDAHECQPIRQRFDEIWESSIPSVSATTTGL